MFLFLSFVRFLLSCFLSTLESIWELKLPFISHSPASSEPKTFLVFCLEPEDLSAEFDFNVIHLVASIYRCNLSSSYECRKFQSQRDKLEHYKVGKKLGRLASNDIQGLKLSWISDKKFMNQEITLRYYWIRSECWIEKLSIHA